MTNTANRIAPPQTLQATAYDQPQQLASLLDTWNTLANQVPFRRWEWLLGWWQYYRTRADHLFVVVLRDNSGTLIALAPWYRHQSLRRGREIRFLGSGQVYSDYLTVLTRDSAQHEQIATTLVDFLHAQRNWDYLVFNRIDAGDAFMHRLSTRLHECGYRIERNVTESCWRVPLAATWEDYLLMLSKKRRYKLRQLCKHYFDNDKIRLHRVTGEPQLARGLATLTALHHKRRQYQQQTDALSSEPFSGFLHHVARQFLDSGDLHLYWLELEGLAVAAAIDFSGGDTLYCYQTGMDPAAAAHQPGWLRIIDALQQAIARDYRYYDFLGGDEPYKAHCKALELPQFDITVINKTVNASNRYRLRSGSQILKTWLKDRLIRAPAP